ncbi:MAG: uroporphyrinogen decarboxylase family protein [Victivallaceae bacterium]
MNKSIDFSPALDALDTYQDQIAAARRRQKRFWAGETVEPPPAVASGALPEVVMELPAADYAACADNPELMLASELRRALAGLAGASDLVPSIRPNLGCAVTLSCIGLEQQFFPDRMPWLTSHLDAGAIADLDAEAVEWRGTFRRGLEMLRFFREILGDRLAIYPMDTQGPFDLAHLIAGDELFLLLYDDPEAVHRLMDFTTGFLIRAIAEMKRITGEPLDRMHYRNEIYSESFGIRICEDTAVLLGGEQIEEFVIPYSRRLAAHFGGSFCHYCGRNDELTARLLAEPLFKVINFGQIPGKETLHDFAAEMEKTRRAGKKYYGCWPHLPGESHADYLARLAPHTENGTLFPVIEPPKA